MLFCIFHCGEWLGCLLLGNAGREHPGFPGQQPGMQEGSPVPGSAVGSISSWLCSSQPGVLRVLCSGPGG